MQGKITVIFQHDGEQHDEASVRRMTRDLHSLLFQEITDAFCDDGANLMGYEGPMIDDRTIVISVESGLPHDPLPEADDEREAKSQARAEEYPSDEL